MKKTLEISQEKANIYRELLETTSLEFQQDKFLHGDFVWEFFSNNGKIQLTIKKTPYIHRITGEELTVEYSYNKYNSLEYIVKDKNGNTVEKENLLIIDIFYDLKKQVIKFIWSIDIDYVDLETYQFIPGCHQNMSRFAEPDEEDWDEDEEHYVRLERAIESIEADGLENYVISPELIAQEYQEKILSWLADEQSSLSW